MVSRNASMEHDNTKKITPFSTRYEQIVCHELVNFVGHYNLRLDTTLNNIIGVKTKSF
jgi:hypothetical protein